ncbi:TPA: hypothetical protein ACH3X2_011108 [Trebouxia sp. C0005]
MSRVYVLVLTAAFLLLALQALLLSSWSHNLRASSEEADKTNKAEQKLHGLLAKSQDLQDTHNALASRAQKLERVHASGARQHQQADQHTDSDASTCIGPVPDSTGVVAAVVVITHNRPEYLKKCMSSVMQVHVKDPSHRQKFPLHISQDGNNTAVTDLARSTDPAKFNMSHMDLSLILPVVHMQHVMADTFPTRKKTEPAAYYRIASHYKFVMRQIFDCWQYPKLIVLEDDMQIAVDFFSYFEAGAKLLDDDPKLYSVSSWNDHGQARHVNDPLRLERSDFFPGLGWMLTNAVWQSLKGNWPAAYWDDWMRLSPVRQGRQTIRPEICRTYNFGEKGSSHGQFYERYLKPVKLNDVAVDWSKQDLDYLQRHRYAEELDQKVASARLLKSSEGVHLAQGLVKMTYGSRSEYEELAAAVDIIGDWKDGVPRASYEGIVKVRLSVLQDEGYSFLGGECLLVPVPVVHSEGSRGQSNLSFPVNFVHPVHKGHKRGVDKSNAA